MEWWQLLESTPVTKHPYGITDREWQVLQLRIAGLINKEIATKLGISYQTIKEHSTSILRRCHARNMVQAVAKILS